MIRRGILSCLILTILGTAAPAFSDSRLGAKQGELHQALAQIGALGHSLGQAVEAYDGATYRLARIKRLLQVNLVELRVERHNVRVAERDIAARVRDLYIAGPTDETLAVVLGARSLDDVITSLETASRLSQEDTRLIRAVTRFKAVVTRRNVILGRQRRAEEEIVAARAAEKQRIVAGLAHEQRLLSSIRGQIAALRREEAAQQARLAEEAFARLAEQRIAQQRALRDVVVGATAVSISADGRPSVVVLPPSAVGSRVIAIAMQYIGDPYVWGAEGPGAFDCSGLVSYVFAQVGVSLPHFAAAQWNYGTYVPRDQLEPGDLVFFENLGHVGIYVGNGDYIQAPQPGDVVKITPLSDPWSSANYYGAKRILG